MDNPISPITYPLFKHFLFMYKNLNLSSSDKQDPDRESGSEPQPQDTQNNKPCLLYCWLKFKAILKFLRGIVFALIAFIFTLIAYSVSFSASVILVPLVLFTLIATKVVQFMGNGEENDTVIKVNILAHGLLCVLATLGPIVMGIFYVIARTVPSLKHGIIAGVPVLEWVNIVCIICGFTYLSSALLITSYLSREHIGHYYVLPKSAAEIVGSLIFWWAEHEVMKRVPALKPLKLLGLRAHKWIESALFILIGHSLITFLTRSIVLTIQRWFVRSQSHPGDKQSWSPVKQETLPTKHLLFYSNGMRSNVSFLLTSLMLLLTWVLYFGTRLNGTSQAQSLVRFGNWTFLCLFIFSFLCLLKAFVLLSWEANAIYIRLTSKILHAGKQLYFLGIISRRDLDIFSLLYKPSITLGEDFDKSPSDIYDEWGTHDSNENGRIRKKLAQKKRDKLRHDLLLPEDYTPTVYDVLQVAQTFFKTRDALSKDMHIPLILEKLQTAHNPDNINDGEFENNLRQLMDGENNLAEQTQGSHQNSDVNNNSTVLAQDSHQDSDVNNNSIVVAQDSHQNSDISVAEANVIKLHSDVENNSVEKTQDSQVIKKPTDFEELLQHASFAKLSGQELQSWMEKSRINCILIGNILSNAKEAVECLNKIISWVLIGGTFLVWLILTGLASTKVLVLIASPLLAGTFIFGDTCKSFFQGIMFVYVVHPFDVGDLCSIDTKLMEVKSVGVWKTIFSNVDKASGQEEVIFPNSELANKVVINHKSEFDCNDYIVFSLDIKDDNKINKLISDIEGHLNHDDAMFTAGSSSVAVLTGEDVVKIGVSFGHKIKLKDTTYFERLKNKDKQRTDLILYVQELVEKASVEEARKETTDSSSIATKTSEIQPASSLK